jgi:hypothetical protein
MTTTGKRRSRRAFLGRAGTTLGGIAVLGVDGVLPGRPAGASPKEDAPPGATPVADWFPRQDPALVERVVAVSHVDLDAVRELVEARPELAKAQWDWGYGDWESALGAASHTGRREIAQLLLRHGARPTLFSAAMLGQLEVVRAFVTASPGIQGTPGPHGIPLLAHARAGGEPAAPVVAFLEEAGGADGGPAAVPLDEGGERRYVGSYRFGPGARDVLEVAVGRFGLALARADGTPRGLTHLGDHTFHPAGARSVRVRFEVSGEAAVALTVHDPELRVRARRVPDRTD